MKFKKKKMSREERAEFKFGKYMGGPAEEKAEMKKKTKRMADGGMTMRTMGKGGAEEMKPAAKTRNENAAAGGGRGTGLPPGLAKRNGKLPPGLAKMAQLPAGLRSGARGTEAAKPASNTASTSTTSTGAPSTSGAIRKLAGMNDWKNMKAGGKVKRMADGGMATTTAKPAETQDPRKAAAMQKGRGTGLPPGLAKRGAGNLPPGLQRMAQLPQGLRAPAAPAPAAAAPITAPAPTASVPSAVTLPSAAQNAVGAAPVRMAKGGMVRGNGCAARGKTKGRMY